MPLSQLADRRRAASRMFEEALARAEAQRQQVDQRTALQAAQAERGFDQGVGQVLHQLGGQGLARGPRSAGRPVRQMRDQLGQDLGSIQFERGEMLAALEALIGETESEREHEFSSIAAEEARIRAQQREAKLAQQAAQAQAEAQQAAIRAMADAQKQRAKPAEQEPKRTTTPPPAPSSSPPRSPAGATAPTAPAGERRTPTSTRRNVITGQDSRVTDADGRRFFS